MIKQILALTAFIFLFVTSMYGQRTSAVEVPSIIKNNFAAAYPQSTDVEWEREGDLYCVEFETGRDVDYKIWYDGASTVVRQEVEITENELPAAVRNAIQQEFPKYKIDDVEKITSPDGETYKVELDAFLQQEWEVVFSAKGKLLSKTED